MNPVDQSRRRSIRPIGGRGLLLPFVALLGLAGCDTFGSRLPNDPFMGVHTPPSPTPVPAPGNVPGSEVAATPPQVPPLPSSYTALGTAPVAGGETATPEGGRDLRIPNSAVRGAAPNITVGNPEPATSGATTHLVPMSGATPVPVPAPAQVAGSSAAIRNFEDAEQFLKQHNVNWQRLELEDDGGWKFQCSAPNPSNPRMNRTYTTNKPFPDPLSAMRAIVSQIEQQPH